MRSVKVHEAKTNLSALLAEVERGGEIQISRGDKPVARLVGIGGGHRELGFLSYEVPDSFDEPLPDDELDAWGS